MGCLDGFGKKNKEVFAIPLRKKGLDRERMSGVRRNHVFPLVQESLKVVVDGT